MDKFLNVAWKTDGINGEADFDINRDNFGPLSSLLPATKVSAFEADLEAQIRSGEVENEADVIDVCYRHGVKRQHAATVLTRLKAHRIIDCEFRVPDVKQLQRPRTVRLRGADVMFR